MNLFEQQETTRPTGDGLKVWSTKRQHWRHWIEPGTTKPNELVDCGLWWWAQYGNGTVCCSTCPLKSSMNAIVYAMEANE